MLETKKKDQFLIDPRNIDIQEGFNGRQNFDPEELAQLERSILSEGVQVPILVKRGKDGRFILVNGERRLRCCMNLIEKGKIEEMRIPATIFTGNEADAVVSMLITNDGVKLSLVEEAEVMSRLEKIGLTKKEISAKTGRTVQQLKTLETIKCFPQKVKKHINEGKVSATFVNSLLKEETIEDAVDLIEKSISIHGKATKQKVEKAQGKTNSIKLLKKLLNDDNISGNGDMERNDFLVRLVNNEIGYEDICGFLKIPVLEMPD